MLFETFINDLINGILGTLVQVILNAIAGIFPFLGGGA